MVLLGFVILVVDSLGVGAEVDTGVGTGVDRSGVVGSLVDSPVLAYNWVQGTFQFPGVVLLHALVMEKFHGMMVEFL